MKFKNFILLFFQLHFCFLVLNTVSGNKLRSHISTLYPEILNVTQRGIDLCYDGHLNGNQIPLFEQNQTGMALVRQYFVSLFSLLYFWNLSQLFIEYF